MDERGDGEELRVPVDVGRELPAPSEPRAGEPTSAASGAAQQGSTPPGPARSPVDAYGDAPAPPQPDPYD